MLVFELTAMMWPGGLVIISGVNNRIEVKTDKQIMMMRETMIVMEMITRLSAVVTVRICPEHVTHNVPYSGPLEITVIDSKLNFPNVTAMWLGLDWYQL